MSDSLTAQKLRWLEQVARDADLRPSAARLAIVMSGLINRETGDAWPSIDHLAAELGMSRRGVQKAVESLVERGYLERDLGGGRKLSNRYKLRIPGDKGRTPVHGFDPKQRTPVHGNSDKQRTAVHPLEAERANGRSDKGRTPVHPTPFKETNEDRDLSLSLSDSQKSSTAKAKSTDPNFGEFWQHYPRKAGRKNAERAFAKAVKDGTDPRDIIAGSMRYAAERDGQEPRFTKHPATWLNGGHWEDEPTPQGANPRQADRRMTASEFVQMRTVAMDGGHQT